MDSRISGQTSSIEERAIVNSRSILATETRPIPKILALIVLYKCSVEESSTYRSIQDQNLHEPDSISFLVYDNSPTAHSEVLPAGWMYVNDPKNQGLTGAYNYAVRRCAELGTRWLLLLDQDSSLPNNFIASLQLDAALCEPQSQIAAIVPLVLSRQRQVSPFIPRFGFDRPYGVTRVATTQWIGAVNSASCVRVSFIQSIGGFSPDFWLDYLDHWFFRQIYDTGHTVFVSEMRVDHCLSVADFNDGLGVDRYQNILTAERTFTNKYLPKVWRPILACRLAARACKHLIRTKDKRLAFLMLKASVQQVLVLFDRTLQR